MHFGRRKSAHATQRVPAEDRGKMLLPRADMQRHIRRRGGRHHRVPPHRAEPFDTRPIPVVNRDALEIVENVAPAHLAQAVEQFARIIQHHARLPARVHQLADEIGGARVTPGKHRRVMVAVDVLVLHHELQVADDRRRWQVVPAQHQRLVHVQRNRERRLELVQPHWRPVQIYGVMPIGDGADLGFCATDVRQTINNFGNRIEFH